MIQFNKSSKSNLLFGFLFVSVIFKIVVFFQYHPIASDGIQYTSLGYNLFHFGIYDSNLGVIPGWLQPPLFPIIIGLFTIIFSKAISGYIVGVAAEIITILLVYNFLKHKTNRYGVIIAVIALAIHPLFLSINTRILSEPVYTVFHLLLFFSVYKILFEKIFPSYRITIITGIVISLMFLVRSEAILYMPLLFLLYLIRVNLKQTVVLVLTILVVLSPYGLFIKSNTGNFNLIPKITCNTRLGKVYNLDKQTFPEKVDHQSNFESYLWFSYDFEEGGFPSDLVMEDEYYQKKTLSKATIENRSLGLVHLVVQNLLEVLRYIIFSSGFPAVFAFLIFIGGLLALMSFPKYTLFILIWIIPTFYFIISHVDARFFYVMLPYFVIITGMGLGEIIVKFRYKVTLISTVIIMMVANNYTYYRNFMDYIGRNNFFHSIAQDLKTNDLVSNSLCTKNFYVSFFGNLDYLKLPICTPVQLQKYLSENNTNFLMLDNEVFNGHAELKMVYEGRSKYFSFVKKYEHGDLKVKLFKLTVDSPS